MPPADGDSVMAGPFGGWIIAPAPNGITSVCADRGPVKAKATRPINRRCFIVPTWALRARAATGHVRMDSQ